jgi:hypothetical protein
MALMLAPLQKFAQLPCLCYRRQEVRTRGTEVNEVLITSPVIQIRTLAQNLLERSGKRMYDITYNKPTSPILK